LMSTFNRCIPAFRIFLLELVEHVQAVAYPGPSHVSARTRRTCASCSGLQQSLAGGKLKRPRIPLTKKVSYGF
jgi:hypothetical protein